MLVTMAVFPFVQPTLAKHFGGASVTTNPDVTAMVADYRKSMLERPLKNIIECKPGQQCRLGAENRFKVLGQKGVTMWMTGLSGSGKTTISKALEKELLFKHGKNVYNIDGDNLRTGLTRDLGFSSSDRGESVRRASEVAALFNEAGVITMVTLISPYRKDRDAARAMHEKRGLPFMEVFMDVPLDVVKARDPKGLYKLVAAGKIKGFTGIDAPYEAPLKPEVLLQNGHMSIEVCVEVCVAALKHAGHLTGDDVSDGLLAPDGGERVDLIVPTDQLPAKCVPRPAVPPPSHTHTYTHPLTLLAHSDPPRSRALTRPHPLLLLCTGSPRRRRCRRCR